MRKIFCEFVFASVVVPASDDGFHVGRGILGRLEARFSTRKTIISKTPENAESSTARPWTFLTHHAHVLILLQGQPDRVLREVAARVRITERAVQGIVQDWEGEGFIRREKVGRKNRYEVLTNESLRHPIESHRTIGDLLELIRASPGFPCCDSVFDGRKRGQVPMVRSTLRAIWLLVPDPFSEQPPTPFSKML